MLDKKNRLKHKKDFEGVLSKGSGCKQDFVFLKYLKNDLKESRFGFVVSNKVSKKAVIRNKIRRRLKNLIRLNVEKIKKGFDFVIIVRPSIDVNDFEELDKEVINLFKKTNTIDE